MKSKVKQPLDDQQSQQSPLTLKNGIARIPFK